MRLSECKGEQALDILADLMEPAVAIMGDKEVVELYRSGAPKIKIIKSAIKNHKKEVVEILALLDGEDPETYVEKINILTLPMKLLDIFNDRELMDLFQSQGQETETSSGSATESTEANEQ